MIKYYDIGLNLFCAQFKHPDTILQRATEAGVACILTGSDLKEDRRVDEYLKAHPEVTVYGTAGLHPHNADDFREEDLQEILAPEKYTGRCAQQVDAFLEKVRPLLSGAGQSSEEIEI